MTAATLIAAVIGAIAAAMAAWFAFKGNEKLQQRQHEFLRQEKSAGRCEELYEHFLDVVRGVDHPIRPTEPISDDVRHRLTMGLIQIARNCQERATEASHVSAQLRMWCPDSVASPASAVVDALNLYGFTLLADLAAEAENGDASSNPDRATDAGAAYQTAVVAYQTAVRTAREGAEQS